MLEGKRCAFSSWVGRWLGVGKDNHSIFIPEESYGQRAGRLQAVVLQELDTTEAIAHSTEAVFSLAIFQILLVFGFGAFYCDTSVDCFVFILLKTLISLNVSTTFS